MIYDHACNSSFHEKSKAIQHNACLAIKVTSTDKLYHVGLENFVIFVTYSVKYLLHLFHLMPKLNDHSPTKPSEELYLNKGKSL